jgi:hypothetical protein
LFRFSFASLPKPIPDWFLASENQSGTGFLASGNPFVRKTLSVAEDEDLGDGVGEKGALVSVGRRERSVYF